MLVKLSDSDSNAALKIPKEIVRHIHKMRRYFFMERQGRMHADV